MNMETIIALLTALSSGGILGVIFERRKRKAETKLLEADLFDKIEEHYKKLLDHQEKKFEELLRENETLKKEVKHLREELKKHKIY